MRCDNAGKHGDAATKYKSNGVIFPLLVLQFRTIECNYHGSDSSKTKKPQAERTAEPHGQQQACGLECRKFVARH
jgi:hypothetical protein